MSDTGLSSTDLDTLIAALDLLEENTVVLYSHFGGGNIRDMRLDKHPEIAILDAARKSLKALTDLRTERDAAIALVGAVFAALDGDGISREYGTFQGDKVATIGGIAAFTAEWDTVSTAPHSGKRWEDMTTQERFESSKFSAQHALIKELAELRATAPATALADRDARILEEAADKIIEATEWSGELATAKTLHRHEVGMEAADIVRAIAASRRREASPQEGGAV